MFFIIFLIRNKNKKGGNYQESIQFRTTPDPGYQNGKWQNTIKHYKLESRGPLI